MSCQRCPSTWASSSTRTSSSTGRHGRKLSLRDDQALHILGSVRGRLADLSPERWQATELKAVLEKLADEIGRKLGKSQAPVRVATLGNTVGLPLFESLEVLGQDRTVRRLSEGLQRLGSPAAGRGGG